MFYKEHPLIISTMTHTIITSITKFHILIILIIISPPQLTNAQYLKNNPTSSNFQPSLFVVIGVLSFMFTLTLTLLIYAKLCHRRRSIVHTLGRHEEGMFGMPTRFSGLDKRVVESLPFFKFSSLKGSKQGLQCSVCLAEFEDFEVLRLLPKCKHGFHLECIDLWLEKHSSCPLCRQNVSSNDMEHFINSTSMRFCIEERNYECRDNQIEPSNSSIFELFVERGGEDNGNKSSKWSIGGSFRRIFKANNEEEEDQMAMYNSKHRLSHRILISDVVFRNRWSNLNSSDLMFLNSEMLVGMPSGRFSWLNNDKYAVNYHESNDHYNKIMSLKEEIERKMNFEHKIDQIKRSNSHSSSKGHLISNYSMENSKAGEKRAMSEITGISRFKDVISMDNKVTKQGLGGHVNVNYEVNDGFNRRKIWFLIARKTVQWFANREENRNRSQQQQQSQDIEQIFDV